jgi:hypothetical protein
VTDGDGSSHWWRWHQDYSDPSSALAARLRVVIARTREAINAAPAGPVRLVSACAGQGHDVVGALRDHPRRADVRGRLIELDPANAAAARTALAEAGLSDLDVLEGDAGSSDAFVGAVPADVVLLCGIFGNISDQDIENTVRAASQLCAPGATVLWTRHRRSPDLTPSIRSWFVECGFEEVAFDSPPEKSFAVGTNRLARDPEPLITRTRLFSFL